MKSIILKRILQDWYYLEQERAKTICKENQSKYIDIVNKHYSYAEQEIEALEQAAQANITSSHKIKEASS